MSLKTIVSGSLLFFALSVQAKVVLPSYYGDHMVLQQGATTTIYGKANSNKEVTLYTSWDNKKYATKSNKEGSFSIAIEIPKLDTKNSFSMRFSDGEILELKDVLLGELWLCSGQSNMEMPVKGFTGQPVFGSHPYIVKAKENRPIRMFTVKRAWDKELRYNVEGRWQLHSSEVVGEFSAAGYFFGDLVQEIIDVPVGLINCSWSASKIEAWMPKNTLENIEGVDLSILKESEFGYPNGTPTLLFNAMINPLKGLAIKGLLWYQGESNSENPAMYKKLFPAFVNDIRTFFGDQNLPVYAVQIAPFKSHDKDQINLALFRQTQLELMRDVSNTGMVITTDLGSEEFIHPPRKIEVGQRLAYWALAKTYGKQGFVYSGPIFSDYKRKDSTVEISFRYGDEGLNPEKGFVEGFEIAGSDNVFVPAKAQIIDATNRVKVWSEEVKDPKEIRYCFRNYMEGTLTNNAGLPASPFRIEIIK